MKIKTVPLLDLKHLGSGRVMHNWTSRGRQRSRMLTRELPDPLSQIQTIQRLKLPIREVTYANTLNNHSWTSVVEFGIELKNKRTNTKVISITNTSLKYALSFPIE